MEKQKRNIKFADDIIKEIEEDRPNGIATYKERYGKFVSGEKHEEYMRRNTIENKNN